MVAMTTDPPPEAPPDEEEPPTHKLTTIIHSGTPLTLMLGQGEATELADRGALLMRLGLIDNMMITRISGSQPGPTDQLTTWLNLAVINLQQHT